MKNLISNSSEILESVKRVLFSFQVLMAAFLLPVLFAIGISSGSNSSPANDVKISRSMKAVYNTKATVHLYKGLSDQNG